MAAQLNSITPAELRGRLHDGGEIAIVDAREEGSFHNRHLLMAACLPLSRLELIAPALLPRRNAPIIVCDDGGGLAARSAARDEHFRRPHPRTCPSAQGRDPFRRKCSRSFRACSRAARPFSSIGRKLA